MLGRESGAEDGSCFGAAFGAEFELELECDIGVGLGVAAAEATERRKTELPKLPSANQWPAARKQNFGAYWAPPVSRRPSSAPPSDRN